MTAGESVAPGIDQSLHRNAEHAAHANRTANDFEIVAREWYSLRAPKWAEKGLSSRVLVRDA